MNIKDRMSLKMNYSDFNEIKHFTQPQKNSGSSKSSSISIDECNPLMLEIMQNLHMSRYLKLGEWTSPLFSSTGSEHDSQSIEKSTVKSDSGYESPFDISKKPSRWMKMDEQLLHKDVKKFLKMSWKRSKCPNESRDKREILEIFRNTLISIESGDLAGIEGSLQSVVKPKEDLTQSLLTMCDGIGMYMDQIATIQRSINKLSGENFDGDLKSIVHYGRTCDDKALKMFNILYQGLKLDETARLIHGMEIFCQHQGTTLDYVEAGIGDLKRSIDVFRCHFSEFKNCGNADNMNNLIKIVRHVCMTLKSITARMWVLSLLIEVR